MKEAYQNSIEEVVQELDTNIKNGLSKDEVEKRQRKYGPNELEAAEKDPWWMMLFDQFIDPLIFLLLFAIVVSAVFGDYIEAVVIALIVILNALLGFSQEYQAEKSLEALKSMVTKEADVIRGGEVKRIETTEIVPGDIVQLKAGDSIPADVRLIKSERFKTDEAALTGESTSVNKNAEAVYLDEKPVADRKNMSYMGTIAVYGKATGIVERTGMDTQFGRIAAGLEEKRSMTPLQEQLASLGKWLGIIILVIISVVFVVEIVEVSYFKQEELTLELFVELFETAIALAVSAVPEGLPAAITVTLAIGVQRMVKRNAIVRKLPAVETLGAVDVICSDKTGTLTKNEMTVREVWTRNGTTNVSGDGYDPTGKFTRDNEEINPKNDPDLRKLIKIGELCNNSRLEFDSEESKWKVIGDPTEGCLHVLAKKAEFKEKFEDDERVAELFFDSIRKRMTTVDKESEDMNMAHMKGSPEIVLERCKNIQVNGEIKELTCDIQDEILEKNNEMANRALRVLAFAYKPVESGTSCEEDIIETDMTFVGLVGMIDPPRSEVLESINKCKRAGIRTIMITGDQVNTARAIAAELNLIDRDKTVALSDRGYDMECVDDDIREIILSEGKPISEQPSIEEIREILAQEKQLILLGSEIDAIPDDILPEIVEYLAICARASPENKKRIVAALQKNGHVVAVTGDGVNDAPALTKADIGVAMGITGTDVSKEASEMVLTDDNFASIVNAVEEGRGIYDNSKKFIRYIISTNFDEIMVVFTCFTLLGLGSPFLAIQILWINLLTDGLPALALSMDPLDPKLMDRRPRARESQLVQDMLLFAFIAGVLAFICTLIVYIPLAEPAIRQWEIWANNPSAIPNVLPDKFGGFSVSHLAQGGWTNTDLSELQDLMLRHARTMAFFESIVFEVFLVWVTRLEERRIFTTNPLENKLLLFSVILAFGLSVIIMYVPFFQPIFHTFPLTWRDWVILLALTLVSTIILDFFKTWYYRRYGEKQRLSKAKGAVFTA